MKLRLIKAIATLGAILWGRALAAEPAPALFAAGQAALTKGDLVSAEADFRKVLELEPNSVPARANLGVVYMRRKNWSRALEQFRVAEKLAPGNPGLELNIGLAYFHQGSFAAAVEPFRSVLQSDPSSLQARYLVGLCLFAAEDYRQAVEALTPLWPSEGDKLTYLYVVALAAFKAGQPELEQKALERMQSLGEGSAEYHLFMGRAWLARQRNADAMKELLEAARINARLPFVHYSLGVIYSEAGKYGQAKAEFLVDSQIEPDLAANYQELGALSMKGGRPQEAERLFEEAISLNQSAPVPYLELAKIYKSSYRLEAALNALNEANKLDAESASVHYLRAQTLVGLGRKDEADKEFALSAQLRKSTRDRLEQQVSGRPGLDAQIGLTQP